MTRGQGRGGWVAMGLLLMAPGLAMAAPPDALPEPTETRAPASAPADKKAEADAHFARGKVLYTQGDVGAALAEFSLALKLVPRWNAIYNAGLCLDKLQRYDEALDMFEAVLRDFGQTMPASNKEVAQRKVTRLRELVGTIDVQGAEPGAAIVIDGRDRGEYPARAPLRVGAGSHRVRVSKAGFALSETRVEVAGRQVVRLEVRLFALTRSGRLKVVEQRGKVLEVVVDGSPVGKTPWDGQLAVGSHVVLLRGEGDNIGTPPVPVSIKLDQTTPLTLAAEELSARLRVEPVPVTATVAIDAVTVGSGGWEGRLRAGPHRVEVVADGFLSVAQEVRLTTGRLRVLGVTLERDPRSPFWRAPPRKPRFLAELTAGLTLLPSFGGDVARTCEESCRERVGVGAHGVVRGGYELGSSFGFGLLAGYLTARQATTDRDTVLHIVGPPSTVRGAAQDTLELRGLLAGAWAGYTLGERVPIHLRLDLGALLGSASDARRFTVAAPTGSSSPTSSSVAERHNATFLFAAPEVRVAFPLSKRVALVAGVSLPFLFGVWGAPRWKGSGHGVYAGTTGYGYFEDEFTGLVVVAIVPSVGARFDF